MRKIILKVYVVFKKNDFLCIFSFMHSRNCNSAYAQERTNSSWFVNARAHNLFDLVQKRTSITWIAFARTKLNHLCSWKVVLTQLCYFCNNI